MPAPNADIVLYGADRTQGVVAVEVGENCAVVYRKFGLFLEEERRPLRLWLLTTEKVDLPGAEWVKLEGEGLNQMALFGALQPWQQARRIIREMHAEHLAYPSPVKTFLTATGITLFKGMSFDELHRMQIDLETQGLSPTDPEARILVIAVSDNRGFEEVLTGPEDEIIARFVRIVQERDPDVIEGHNLYGFDLPFLQERAARCRINLALGRDGSHLRVGAQRNCTIGGTTRPFTHFHIYGRHLIDTLFATQRFDWARGELMSYGLKDVAQALGITEEGRVRLDRRDVQSQMESNEEQVKLYALQDVRETRKLSQIVGATDFYVTQMVPDTYESAAVTGTGEKIDSILVREYLRRGHAIPLSKPPRPYPGGLTECRVTGVVRNVVKADVESLYPSLMLSRRIRPSSDTLDVFLPALEELTRRRLEAKSRAKSATGVDAAYWDGLQSSFKILINSFYGYLAGPFHFNDYDAAEAVTLGGQEVLTTMARLIEERGGRVIEMDTDGVYFQTPPGISGREGEQQFVAEIAAQLPSGIRLAYEGSYAAMISLKMKNYVLVGYDGSKIFKGSALRSRADEPFGREFIAKAVDLLVQGQVEKLGELYRDTLARLQRGELEPAQFCRRERVTENTFGQALSKRWARILDRVRVGDYVNVYRRTDGTLGLLEEYAHDEDRDHLAEKLYKFALRLKEAVGPDFDRLFPKPRPQGSRKGPLALQTQLDLG